MSNDTFLTHTATVTNTQIPRTRPAVTNYNALPFVFFRDASAAFKFNKEAISNLSLADRILFEQFGQGPIAQVPFACLHHAFEAYAASQPQETAVFHGSHSISYGELDRQANRLATVLAQHGVSTGDNVALFLQRSIPMVVGILATLKAGAAYVPQHLGVAPEAHLSYVLETANINVILTLSHLQHLLPATDNQTVIAVDELMQEPFGANDYTKPFGANDYTKPFAPAVAPSQDNTCFIIFTSGTTGNPNGVQVTHGNAGNILLTSPGNLGMGPGIKVGQILSIAFDMSVWEILGSLGNGATLVIRGKDFMETIRQVDVVIATPSILSTFDVEQAQNVKVVAVAGEPCPRPLADKWSQFCTFYNSCGPTETTIINTAQYYKPWHERLTIGKPTPNNTVYVLDENLNPLPIGEVGEMWAGGDCVSAGYIGNKELTNVRYRPDPFLGNGRFMFNTRDLGRWTPDGELEHFGRTDDQVKVRGFRVELDSVSAALESVAGVKRAVTLKLDNRHLVGFVSPAHIDPEEAQAAVAASLPYYCVPKFVLTMDELLMTPRGKIDKRALLKLAQAFDERVKGEDVKREQVKSKSHVSRFTHHAAEVSQC